jgi:2-oxoglutarate ferredoxin oxidoreductase subunit beta
VIDLEEGAPLLFANGEKGIVLDGFTPRIVDLAEVSADDCWVHDPTDKIKASILSRFFDYSVEKGALPRPFGIFFKEDRPTYEQVLEEQLKEHEEEEADLDQLLSGPNWWKIGAN